MGGYGREISVERPRRAACSRVHRYVALALPGAIILRVLREEGFVSLYRVRPRLSRSRPRSPSPHNRQHTLKSTTPNAKSSKRTQAACGQLLE